MGRASGLGLFDRGIGDRSSKTRGLIAKNKRNLDYASGSAGVSALGAGSAGVSALGAAFAGGSVLADVSPLGQPVTKPRATIMEQRTITFFIVIKVKLGVKNNQVHFAFRKH